MFESKYDDDQKRRILNERVTEKLTVRTICEKYDITPPTFYSWKYKFGNQANYSADPIADSIPDLESENEVLRRLYINLSAHNYELAKFLNK
ncbi:transposase [uncultured Fluviicola sp.]|uniref:transposase n=1 Tax=uncultured Fluviicola sp. TaxID=463303 RepID=UPI0025F4B477|nr:transposase [uncultured Fluviicola sp.]